MKLSRITFKAYLVLSLSAALLCLSCSREDATDLEAEPPNATPEYQFVLTTEPQRAVFLTQKGWTGGGGDPVYVPGQGWRARLHGRRIVLKSPAQRLIDERAGSPDRKGQQKILVEADVHLEATGTLYSVVIDELLRAEWR